MAGNHSFGIKVKGPNGDIIKAELLRRADEFPSKWLPKALEAIGRYGRQVATARQFEAEGGYWGTGRWQENMPGYADWKAAAFGSTQIGVRTGALRDALTLEDLTPISRYGQTRDGQSTSITATPVLDVTGDSVTFGATAYEDGESYADSFDMTRGIYGEGVLPPDLQKEGGKILNFILSRGTFKKPIISTDEDGQRHVTGFEQPTEDAPDAEVLAMIRQAGAGELL